MTADPLADAQKSVKWANKDIRKVDVAVHNFAFSKPYRIVREINANRTQEIAKLRFVSDIPDEVTEKTKTALQHLRSALDYLAWQVANRGGAPANPKDVAFTICDTRKLFEDPSTQGKIQKIGGADWLTFLNGLKPYPGGNDLLYALNVANNTDKHRVLRRFALRAGGSLAVKNIPVQITSMTILGGIDHALEDGMGIVAYPVVPGEQQPEVEMTANIAFGEIEAVKGQPIVVALRQFSRVVEDIIELGRRTFFS